MENFTKNSLKAAVAKYGSLLESASEEALVAELKKDERAFTDDQIAEIVAAVKAPVQPGTDDGDDDDDHIEGQEIPEWAAQKLIGLFKPLFDELREEIADLKKALVKLNKEATPNAVKVNEVQFNDGASYIVAEGKSFRDPKDFTKEYSYGEDITHLGAEKLQSLLANGLIEEA